MKSFVAFLALLSVAFAAEDDVLVLTDANFHSNIKQHEVILVEFYAPWCGHCKALKPAYEAAATRLKENDPPIPLAKVDCTVETKVCQEFGVSGYPTLKIFKNGEFSMEYGGPREENGIVNYMISKAGPTCKEITSVGDADKFVSGHTPVVFGFFKSAGSKLQSGLQGAADSLNEDFRFAFTTDGDVLKKFDITEDSIVLFYPKMLHNKFEPKQIKYDSSDSSKSAIKLWVEKNAMGLCGVRSGATAKFFQDKPQVFAVYDANFKLNPKQANYWRNRVIKVAKKFLDAGKKLTLAVSDINEMQHELGEFGLDNPDKSKVFVIARDTSDRKFRMKDDFSMATFETFLQDFLDGKLEPYLKSEEIPSSNDEPVKVVVAKQFDDIVNAEDKDVLIEFYAPWCGHCKQLVPKYEELATKLKDEPSIVIAKMDATANDVPSPYQVTGFPTIYFAPKGDKKNPRQYNGGREVNDFLKYLAAESTDPLVGFDRSGKPKKTDL